MCKLMRPSLCVCVPWILLAPLASLAHSTNICTVLARIVAWLPHATHRALLITWLIAAHNGRAVNLSLFVCMCLYTMCVCVFTPVVVSPCPCVCVCVCATEAAILAMFGLLFCLPACGSDSCICFASRFPQRLQLL